MAESSSVFVSAPKKRKLQRADQPYHWDNSQADIVAKQYDAMKAGLFTDFTIYTKDGGKFNVHRLCLARIPYFYDMFSNPMRESEQKTAHEDIHQDVFGVILEYIYTGKSDDIPKYVEEVIICADKYRMDELVEWCSRIIMETLCVNNAVRYLSCVNSIELDNPRKVILQFIERNIEEVMKSEDWSIIVQDFLGMTAILKELGAVRTSGSTLGKLSVCQEYVKWEIPRVSRLKLRPECYYELESPEFTFTDLFGLKYLIKIKYHAKPEGNATIIVFLCSNKTEFRNKSKTLQPPSLQCKWKDPTNDDAFTLYAGQWRFLMDSPQEHIWFFMASAYTLDNPFMVNQVFMFSLYDPHIQYDIPSPQDSRQPNPNKPISSEHKSSFVHIIDSGPCNTDTEIYVHGELITHDSLAEKLSPQNAVDTLLCAIEAGSKKFKSSVLQFITHNVNDVIASKDWIKMQQHKPLVASLIKIISSIEPPITVAKENYLTWKRP
uniref:BTB and MATH domain-containing protein 43 n=1 Tax=Lygus hesperus TaxID=30085 RepID=A0A146M4S7_LYGHE